MNQYEPLRHVTRSTFHAFVGISIMREALGFHLLTSSKGTPGDDACTWKGVCLYGA